MATPGDRTQAPAVTALPATGTDGNVATFRTASGWGAESGVAGPVAATTFSLSVGSAPSAANATGVAGTIRVASGFIYVCVATDTWQRVAIAAW